MIFIAYNPPMIPFDEIDQRLRALDKTRAWLAQQTGRSADSLRTALAPNAPAAKRTNLLQIALSNAIEQEEIRQNIRSLIPGTITLNPTQEQFDAWSKAFKASSYKTMTEWMLGELVKTANEWVLQGRPPFISKNLDALSTPEPTLAPNVTYLPFYGLVAAGTPAGTLDDMPGETIAVPGTWPTAAHFALRISGRSMEPDYPDGATIVCRKLKPGEYPTKGQDVIASDASGAYFKRLAYSKAGTKGKEPRKPVPHLVSINPAFPEVVPATDCPVTAIVVGKADPTPPKP